MASLSPFFGVKLSGNVVKTIKDLQVHEDECLHLSAACLQQAESGSTEYVLSVVKSGGDPIVVCILNSQSRQVHLDLVVDNTDSLQLKVNGKDSKNAVHISGFYDVDSGDDEASDDGHMELVEQKPDESMEDTNASDGQHSGSGSDSASEDEASAAGEEESDTDAAPVETAEVEVTAAAAVSSSDGSSDEQDEASDASGSEGSDSEEEEPIPEPKKQVPAKKQAPAPAKKDQKKQVEEVKKGDQKKRKAEAAHPESSPSKKSNNEVDNYVASVVKFLKARGGVARIGVIGGQCKKPASVKGLTKLFTDRKEFKVSGEEVHLA